MPKLAVTKPSKGKKKKNPLLELKEKILKCKNQNIIVNGNPFEVPEQENMISCIWRNLLHKPTKNSVKYGCPHNLYEIFKEFYPIDNRILCTNNKNCIYYNGGENNIRNDMIVRELTFKDLNINWGNKRCSKTQLMIQYNHEQPILIQLHRRGGTTFVKDFRPGNYDRIHNKLKNSKKSKKKYERLSLVFRKQPITFCVNNKITLEFELETSCNDHVDKVSDVVGGIGLCAAPPDNHIQNCILFRTNLIDNDTYLSSRIRVISKTALNYGDTIKIGTLEVPLYGQFVTNNSINNNNIGNDSNSNNISNNTNNNIVDNNNNISNSINNNLANDNNNNNNINIAIINNNNNSNISEFPDAQITIEDQWNHELEQNSIGQLNSTLQILPNYGQANQLFHQTSNSIIANYNNVMNENTMLKEFVKYIERYYPNQITEFVTLHPEYLSLSLYSIYSPPPIFSEHLDNTSSHNESNSAENIQSLIPRSFLN